MAKKEVKQYLTDVLINKIDYYVSIKKFDFDTIKEMLAIDLIDYEPYMIQTIDKYIKYIIWLDQKNKNKSEAFLKFLNKYQQEQLEEVESNEDLESQNNNDKKNDDNLLDYQQRKKHQTWLDQYFRKQKAKYHVYDYSSLDDLKNNFDQNLNDEIVKSNDDYQNDEQIVNKDFNLTNLITNDSTFYQTSTISLNDLKTNDDLLNEQDEKIIKLDQNMDKQEIELDPEEFGTANINFDKLTYQDEQQENQVIKTSQIKDDEIKLSLDEDDLTKDSWIEEKDLTNELIKDKNLTNDNWIEDDSKEIKNSLDQKLISEHIVEKPNELIDNDEVEKLDKYLWIEKNQLNKDDLNTKDKLNNKQQTKIKNKEIKLEQNNDSCLKTTTNNCCYECNQNEEQLKNVCKSKDNCQCNLTDCKCQNSCSQNQTDLNKIEINQEKNEHNLKTSNNKIWTINPESNLNIHNNEKDFLESKSNQITNQDQKYLSKDITSNLNNTKQQVLNSNNNKEVSKVIELNKPVKLYQQVKWNDKNYYVVGIKLKKDVFGHETPVLKLESLNKPYEIIEVKFIKKY
ncbi:Putative uncharacterized protein [Mycoplasma leachii 99/014/6]|uniref:hypothetical protein n=1 Tax=Mycoplasma leachii TaxID=2105 RepID=UPI000217715C|nr:hypothetical protein [Mycoplasma leachii]CBV66980.1 Putative uncharacterized protein [Mycoplasma leachii 99/014/6]